MPGRDGPGAPPLPFPPGSPGSTPCPPADPVAARAGLALDRLAGDRRRIGIALSGGGDSTALMHLAHCWAHGRAHGAPGGERVLMAATVDHGLRPASADEARAAGRAAAALGIAHEILPWRHGLEDRAGDAAGHGPGHGQADGPAHGRVRGNLMAAAREARLGLLADWAGRHGLGAVLLGHTMDDQAETLLMRLARGAGVDGLAAMAPAREALGLRWLRPLLDLRRAELRGWLTARGIGWIEDPSNDDPGYERVRIRRVLADPALPADRLALSAANLAMARDALCEIAARSAAGAEAPRGALALPLGPFRDAPAEIQRRLLVAGARLVTGAAYPPRRAAVLAAMAALERGLRCTLDGVLAEPREDRLWLTREAAAALRAAPAHPDAAGEAVWDRRWHLTGLAPGHEVAALGHDELPPGPSLRAAGLGRDEAAASPAVRAAGRLVAAPLLRPASGITLRPLRGLGALRALIHTQ